RYATPSSLHSFPTRRSSDLGPCAVDWRGEVPLGCEVVDGRHGEYFIGVLYNLLKLLHILFAITAVGSNFSYGIWQALAGNDPQRSEEHTSELQSRFDLVCRL